MQDGSSVVIGHDNESPTYRILHNPTSTRSEVSCCEKNDPPSSMVVGIDEGSESSDDLKNEYDGTQNVKTTGSDNVEDDDEVKNQDDTLTLRLMEKSNRDIAGEKTMNCK